MIHKMLAKRSNLIRYSPIKSITGDTSPFSLHFKFEVTTRPTMRFSQTWRSVRELEKCEIKLNVKSWRGGHVRVGPIARRGKRVVFEDIYAQKRVDNYYRSLADSFGLQNEPGSRRLHLLLGLVLPLRFNPEPCFSRCF